MAETRATGETRRGRRSALILGGFALVVAGLIVVLVLLQNREPPPIDVDELMGPPKPEIYRLDIDGVVRVELDGPAREPFVLELKNDVWTSSAGDIPIDPNRAYDLQATFGSLYAERVIEEDPADLSVFGLDPPQVVGVATLADGSTVELRLGNRSPSGNWYIMKPDDPRVYAVWINHGKNLYYTIDDLRQDELPVPAVDTIEYVFLRKPDGETIEIDGFDGTDPRFFGALTRLHLRQPYDGWRDLDLDEFVIFRGGLSALSIQRAVSDDPRDAAEYGLDPPRAELRVRDSQGVERHIYLGAARDDEVFFQVVGRDTIYAGRSNQVGFLSQEPFPLMGKLLLMANVGLVDDVRIRHPGGESVFAVTHTTSGNDETESFALDGAELDTEIARRVYRYFIGLTADAEPDPDRLAAAQRAPTEVTITYQLREAPHTLELRFRPYDAQFYLSEQDGRGHFLVDRAKVTDMLAVLRDPATARP